MTKQTPNQGALTRARAMRCAMGSSRAGGGKAGRRAVDGGARWDDRQESSTYQSRALMWPSSRPMISISKQSQRGVLVVLVDGILSKQVGDGEGGRWRI